MDECVATITVGKEGSGWRSLIWNINSDTANNETNMIIEYYLVGYAMI
jgi:hypothetical protein